MGQKQGNLEEENKKAAIRGWGGEVYLESNKAIRDWSWQMAHEGQFFLLFLFLLRAFFAPLRLHLCDAQPSCRAAGWHQTARLALAIPQNKQL